MTGNFHDGSIFENLRNHIQGASPSEPTREQITSLKQLNKILDLTYGIDIIGGHKDFALEEHKTSCPGNLAYPILEEEDIINYEE